MLTEIDKGEGEELVMMMGLLYEYKETLRETIAKRDQLKANAQTEEDENDVSQYNLMISSLQYIIRWIDHGRQPNALRGADKKEAILMNNVKLSVLGEPLPSTTLPSNVDIRDQERIEDALSALTKKERDAYVLHHAEQLSMKRISKLMNVEKSTVQGHIERAEKKIKKQIESSLFQLT